VCGTTGAHIRRVSIIASLVSPPLLTVELSVVLIVAATKSEPVILIQCLEINV
jgi:hypothetical protein